VRSTAGCTHDTANDTPAGATALVEGVRTATICGDDVDWWSLGLTAGGGARVIVRSDPARLTVFAEALDGEEEAENVTAFRLIGVTIFEIASATSTQSVHFKVSGNDVSGAYTIRTELLPGLCLPDILDLYGDRDAAQALLFPPDIALELRACIDDVDVVRVPVERSDLWSFFARFAGASQLELGVMDGAASISRVFTKTSTSPLVRSAADGGEWTITVEATSVPSAGEPYDLELFRQAGPRLEACAAAQPAAASQTIDFTGATDIGAIDCPSHVPSFAPERLLRLDPPRPGALLHVEARPMYTTATVAIALLGTCADDASVIACDSALRPGGPSAIEAVATSTSQPLYLLVSVDSARPGPVTIDVRWDQPGDFTCRMNGPEPIVSSGERSVSTEAATNTREIEATGACGGTAFAGDGAGPDRWFSLSVGGGQRAALELTGTLGGFLWAGTDCETMSDTCVGAAEVGFGRAARVVLAPMGATNFLIAVDGTSWSDAGAYILRAVLAPQCIEDAECRTMPGSVRRCDDYRCSDPPANDRCEGAILVALAAGRATIEGSTGAASDDFTGTGTNCGGSGGQDVVYAVDVPAGAQSLRARITRATWDPILAVRRDQCATASSQVACNDDPRPNGQAESPLSDLTVTTPSAGRYYVIVDAYAGAGPFTLELTLQ
jgi:hypothetical protein